MNHLRALASRIFVEGLTGMAHGLFATLIIGTILTQLGGLLPDGIGDTTVLLGRVAASVTGAGIGLGTALRLKASTFTTVSAAVAGQVGAQAGAAASADSGSAEGARPVNSIVTARPPRPATRAVAASRASNPATTVSPG